MERTYEISDIDGSNKRTVTLAQFQADRAKRRPYTNTISTAWRLGDMAGVEQAQASYRAAFPNV